MQQAVRSDAAPRHRTTFALAVMADASQLLQTVLGALGGGAVALGVAAFLGRRFIELQTSKALERYRSELQQRSEALKAELSIYAHEQSVGLSRLDEQRSAAIQRIYGIATQWQDVYLEICKPSLPNFPAAQMGLQHRYNLATKLLSVSEELSVAARDAAILFNEGSYSVIAQFGSKAMDLACGFLDRTFGHVDMAVDPDYEALFETFDQEREILLDDAKGEFAEVQQLLVEEFRVLMNAKRPASEAGSR